MERCTDNRSSTPPLKTIPITSKTKENGKQFEISLYDKDDQVDICRPMSSTADDTLYVSSTPRASKSRFAIHFLYQCQLKIDFFIEFCTEFMQSNIEN